MARLAFRVHHLHPAMRVRPATGLSVVPGVVVADQPCKPPKMARLGARAGLAVEAVAVVAVAAIRALAARAASAAMAIAS